MPSRTLICACFLLAAVYTGFADDPKPADVPEATRIAWLKSHTAPLRTINPTDEDFADLEPIGKAIGDSRIVFLSEQSHGDGATFHARTRLIKYLHQKCGFDVLAFESGLYDCRKAWELLREGKMPAHDAISQGVFGIWTNAQELQPMFQYIGDQARQPRPLEICGFDCQFTGPASRRFLGDDIAALMKKLPADSLTPAQRDAVAQGLKHLARPGAGASGPQDEAFAALRKALASAQPSETLPVSELAYWRQFTDSLIALSALDAARKPDAEGNPINLRDIQMGKNLVWLAHDVYPKRKIIVWAAAFHLMRNQSQVGMVTIPAKTAAERETVASYESVQTMGNEAWKHLERETYSIFFTAAEGEFQSLPMPKAQKLAPVQPASLEDLLIKAGSENAFFDLRGRGTEGKWLEDRLVARFLGNQDYEADWTKVCDGVVFTRKQFGVTPAHNAQSARYQPQLDPKPLSVPFERYTTKDAFDRTITYYLSRVPKENAGKLPIAVFVQGSGCASVFHDRDGKLLGGLQNLLLSASQGRYRVLVVEKPGVTFGNMPEHPGTSEEASPDFRKEHTLPRWVEAVNAAIRATHRLEGIDWTRTLVVGHSEGGIVAAHIAAANTLVTHVAVLSSGGPSQLFDLMQTKSADEIRDGWAQVQSDPDNAEKLWLGHPHRRWSSFATTSTLDGLLAGRAAIFAAYGTSDKVVPPISFDLLCAELTARGRDFVPLRMEGADHGFRKPGDSLGDPAGFRDVFTRMAAWFSEKHVPLEAAIKREMDRLQGEWKIVAINRDGDEQPFPRNTLVLSVNGEERTVTSGDQVMAQSRYRIDPLSNPASIDVVLTQGASRGQTLLGIYEINGNQMRVCLAAPGAERPKNFPPQPGSGWVMQELNRETPKRAMDKANAVGNSG
ncbi:MAG: alpha/beta fold hydrolase [Gemmataceae bacterium]